MLPVLCELKYQCGRIRSGKKKRNTRRGSLLKPLGFFPVSFFCRFVYSKRINSFSILISHPPTPGFALLGPATILQPSSKASVLGDPKFWDRVP